MGKGITSFKKGINEGQDEIANASAEQAKDITPQPTDAGTHPETDLKTEKDKV